MLVLLAVPAFVFLVTLGTWQVQRLAWKETLLDRIDTQMSAQPVALEEVVNDLDTGNLTEEDIEYLPVSLSGTFDNSGEQFFFATHRGVSGYYVYTPLELAGELQGGAVFVNRGFVPFDFKDQATRPESLVEGEQQIIGLARKRLYEKPSWIVPNNDLEANIYYWKDLSNMAAQAGYKMDGQILPFFVDAGLPSEFYPMGEWPVPGVTLINLPNNHLQYALTWYALAGTLVVVLFVFVRRRMS